MLHISNPPRERNGRVRRPFLERLARRFFAAADGRAAHHGWRIEDRGLRGRRYRDPRFLRLAACPDHTGPEGAVCAHCGARFFKELS